jgi:hypothetical protein
MSTSVYRLHDGSLAVMDANNKLNDDTWVVIRGCELQSDGTAIVRAGRTKRYARECLSPTDIVLDNK